MNDYIVFLVHGMGVYVGEDGKPATAWHDKAKASIKAAYEKHENGLLSNTNFDAIRFVPISYDEIFHQVISNWEENSAALADLPFFGELTAFFAGAGEVEDNFFWTHAGDVVLWRYFDLLQRRIVEGVKLQIMQAMKDNRHTPWGVIAHSLGTAVTARVITDYVDEYGDEDWFTQPNLVAMIANVSRVLEPSDEAAYASMLLPGTGGPENYFSTAHQYDPFMWVKPFKPDESVAFGAQWSQAKSNKTFIEADNLSHVDLGGDGSLDDRIKAFVTSAQPHSFAHYFAEPKVHLPVLARITGKALLTSQIDAASESYRNSLDAAHKDAVKAKLGDLADDWADDLPDAVKTHVKKAFQEIFKKLEERLS